MNFAKLCKCSFCNLPQLKIMVYDNSGSQQFINPETNKQWKGTECPDCVEYFKTEEDPTLKITTRKCKSCQKYLPSSRYFHCQNCKPLVSVMDDFIYETEELDDHMIALAEDLLED